MGEGTNLKLSGQASGRVKMQRQAERGKRIINRATGGAEH